MASGLNINYVSKDTITLQKKGKSHYVEIANSRVEQTKMKVKITHQDGQVEQYKVQVDRDDKRKKNELLELKVNSKQATLGLKRQGHYKILLQNGKLRVPTNVASKVMGPTLSKDIKHLVRNLDKNVSASDIKTRVESVKISCKKRSSKRLVCTTFSKVNAEIDRSKKTSIGKLVGHLKDLRKEMSSNLNVKYDMEGYREFLDKSEKLVKTSLKSIKSKSVISKLLDTKQLIIDERIESYEYTAIRAKSIVSFVNKVLKELGQTS
jgi:hypothetical protein